MVTLPEDSIGPTALLKGGMAAKWAQVEQTWRLTDCYLKAEERRGPRYTRRAQRGDRLDQSRLDRVYASDNETLGGKTGRKYRH
ncbi:hypothetical protein R1sor_014643 [Riccia sorocarpa]|uniref:Uncharacterized protein n=1 Tax=Riccia sorocarpa TaxID=122646 RepID=A0ABD3HCU3_9MARC